MSRGLGTPASANSQTLSHSGHFGCRAQHAQVLKSSPSGSDREDSCRTTVSMSHSSVDLLFGDHLFGLNKHHFPGLPLVCFLIHSSEWRS